MWRALRGWARVAAGGRSWAPYASPRRLSLGAPSRARGAGAIRLTPWLGRGCVVWRPRQRPPCRSRRGAAAPRPRQPQRGSRSSPPPESARPGIPAAISNPRHRGSSHNADRWAVPELAVPVARSRLRRGARRLGPLPALRRGLGPLARPALRLPRPEDRDRRRVNGSASGLRLGGVLLGGVGGPERDVQPDAPIPSRSEHHRPVRHAVS